MYPGRDLSVKGNGVMSIRFAVSMEPEMNSGIVVKPKNPGLGCSAQNCFLPTNAVTPADCIHHFRPTRPKRSGSAYGLMNRQASRRK
jgi:hypothetical protein